MLLNLGLILKNVKLCKEWYIKDIRINKVKE